MLPTLRPGGLVLTVPRRPRVGDIVVALHPETRQPIIKRLKAIESDGLWLEGDAHDPKTAAASSDSWVFGAVSPDDIVGVAWPLRRFRRQS